MIKNIIFFYFSIPFLNIDHHILVVDPEEVPAVDVPELEPLEVVDPVVAAAFAVPVYDTIITPLILGGSLIMIGGYCFFWPVTRSIGIGLTVYVSCEK